MEFYLARQADVDKTIAMFCGVGPRNRLDMTTKPFFVGLEAVRKWTLDIEDRLSNNGVRFGSRAVHLQSPCC